MAANVFGSPRVSIESMRKSSIAFVWLGLALLGLASTAQAQSAGKPSFDVASIKPADPPQPGRGMIAFGRRGGPGTDDPGRITWNNATLMAILTTAYDVKRYQVTGPDWLDSERFDVVAKVPAGATKEQVNLMWQNLIEERWGVALHHTSKVFQVDEMMPAKGGPKLKETDLDPNAATPPPAGGPPPFIGPPKLDKNGFPQLPGPGIIMMMTMGPNGPNSRMVGRAQTLEQLANILGNQLNRPVVDKTGLTGKYDFTLEFAPEPGSIPAPPGGMGRGPEIPRGGGDGPSQIPGANDPSGLTLVGALQQQLGLRLQPAKAPLDVLVIDRADKVPTEN
jgi:uncharacterized protein (TIGR03435 family)